MPSVVTVSRWPQRSSVRPPPVPRARTRTVGRPGVASSVCASRPASRAHAATNAAASRSPEPPGTSDGLTESIATSAWISSTRPRARMARSLVGLLLREPEPVRDGRRLRAAAHVELGEDPRDVHARGLLCHEELRADLAVGRATGDEREHLALARRQAERILGLGVRLRRRRGVAVAVEPQAGARYEALGLAGEPPGAEPPRDRGRLAGRLRRGGAVVGGDVRLRLAPAGDRDAVGPLDPRPRLRRVGPEAGCGL